MNEALKKILIPGTDARTLETYETIVERAKTATFGLDEHEYVILDTETTGLSFDNDSVIEIAAATMKGPEIVSRFQTFVRPEKPLSEEISELTGITPEMLKDAPEAGVAVAQFAKYCGSRTLVAHNATFDSHFIRKGAAGTSADYMPQGEWVDSLHLARIAFPRFTSHRLGDLARAFDLYTPTHRATDDVEATCQLWRLMFVAISDFTPGLAKYIAEISPDTPWDVRSILSSIAAADDAKFQLKESRMRSIDAVASTPRNGNDGALKFCDEEELKQYFTQESILGHMYEGFETRDEQLEMTCAVNNAFQNEENCVIEAGTGVGKSIAYLVPAAIGARRNNITIGIASKTNALTDQLVYHELPLLKDALEACVPEFQGKGKGLRYTALKGFEHYPCLRKVQRMARRKDISSEDLQSFAMLLAFIAQTPWGDLDSINMPGNALSNLAVTTSADECMRRHCTFCHASCYLHGLRKQASSSDIVITNHALLFCDISCDGGVLPPIYHWVVDEAHSVEDEARRQLSCGISARDLNGALYELSGANGVFNRMRRALNKFETGVEAQLPELSERKEEEGVLALSYLLIAEEKEKQAETMSESFFSFVKDLSVHAKSSSYDSAEIWINEEVRSSAPWGVVTSVGNGTIRAIDELFQSCKDLITVAEQHPALKEEAPALTGIACKLKEAYDGLCVVIDDPSDEYVYSAYVNKRPEVYNENIIAERYDVGNLLSTDFYPHLKSVVYCSATITTADSFEHFKDGVGLNRAKERECVDISLGSSYDFDNNMVVYVPNDMLEPNHPSYMDSLERMLYQTHKAMGGSVLTLFTNRRDMEEMYNRLKRKLAEEGISLACQSRGTSKKVLRDEFISNKELCLFALKSFWEGFDAPGDTLKCVIIPKLPFSVPTEPLALERGKREANAWTKYSLPEAVISLKQAAGRLIRSSTDTGCLVLADARLLSKGYGQVFLKSLPSQHQIICSINEMSDDIAGRYGN